MIKFMGDILLKLFLYKLWNIINVFEFLHLYLIVPNELKCQKCWWMLKNKKYINIYITSEYNMEIIYSLWNLQKYGHWNYLLRHVSNADLHKSYSLFNRP